MLLCHVQELQNVMQIEFPDLKVTFEGTPYYLSGLLKDSDSNLVSNKLKQLHIGIFF